jgi:acetyltransferase-like isoleucine patch superfamily enzyme
MVESDDGGWCAVTNIPRFLLDHVAMVYRSFAWYLYNYILTNCPWHGLRVFYLRRVLGIPIGERSFVHMGCLFYAGVSIGRNCVVGRECHLLGDITIGSNVSITAQTYIFSATHDKDSPDFSAYSKPVVIEDFVWIGARAMILPGVHIGKGAILGAASTATRDIGAYRIWVGAPAREIGRRSEDLRYQLNHFPYFQ